MAKSNEFAIGLFEPGMTYVHRVGLAGLYMTLQRIQSSGQSIQGLEFELKPDRVTLSWGAGGPGPLAALCQFAFGRTASGLVDFGAHRAMPIGDLERIELTRAVLGSFLQHNKQNLIPKGTANRTVSIELNEQQVMVEYRPLVKPYAHAELASQILNKKGVPKDMVAIKGWLYPGGAKRHSSLTGAEMEESPGRSLCLAFAPVASLYYRLYHREADGSFDKRRGTAVCFPHLNNVERYAAHYQRYLDSPVERLSADGPGDAGLSALVTLRAKDRLADLDIAGCTVITMGTVGWSKQQRTRTEVFAIDEVEESTLDLFDLACRCLSNKILVRVPQAKSKKGAKTDDAGPRYFVTTSLARGLVADNIAAGREWFHDFTSLMSSEKRSRQIGFDRKGLNEMVDKIEWQSEADKRFVEAVHDAVRSRYGAIAARAKEKGEKIPFDREFTRMRTGLMRVKNTSTLRAELADLFARGGINRTLQTEWREILPLFTGADWQRARDLALLALASYTGRGAEDLASTENNDTEEDQP